MGNTKTGVYHLKGERWCGQPNKDPTSVAKNPMPRAIG